VEVGTRGKLWAIKDGLITVAGHVYLLPSSPCVQLVLAVTHEAGREGIEKSLHPLRHDIHLPGTHTAVWDCVHSCIIYQQNKGDQLHPDGLLQPLNIHSTV
jgi:hypothetical protein